MTGPKSKGGRPTKYTDKLAADICQRLMCGESLRFICSGERMPTRATVFNWLHAKPEFFDQYARAREAQADTLFDECLDIADDGTNDYVERETKKGVVVLVDHEHISRSKLRVDTRMTMAKRLAPKRYGDKLDLNHSGKVDISPVLNLTVPSEGGVAGDGE